ncbi:MULTISPECIES: outer membrane protein assembly factor BamB [unclassified Polaromonas]|jgi:outer membrane assembly lipoprotein YfgL|uniref:outer membrane protein assembly factor BamB n=1 Tax=unclassified Polaromonas TaxID=2638319 RepID=UPI0018CAF5DD|nr:MULTISPECIES: outer membrane protein assembly factor BamB [unclassified Polaromonas]
MKIQSFWSLALAGRAPIAIISVALLTGCFGGVKKPQPTELQPVTALVSVRQSWTQRIGPVNFPLDVGVAGSGVAVASDDGTVALFDAQTGREVWRLALKTPIAAGVGSDGKVLAVITKDNEVIAMQAGRELWRQKLTAQAFTAPFVAGERVFVLAADRSVNAFDGQTGRKLWTQQRSSEPLVLRQSGVLLAVGDTLVVGLAGRLVGMNPSTGGIQWEAPVATPRGINDIERLVDLVGSVSRVGDNVCVRAFQSSIGCVNTTRGNLLWTRPANGVQGINGDDRLLFGTEADGTVLAWKRSDGERVWSTERLRYRGLTAPFLAGRSVVIGDAAGFIHLLSREDGSLLNRIGTDGSPISASPVLAGNTLVAVTRNGGIYGFQPE